MRSKARVVRQILRLPVRKLPAPRILLTVDLGEEEYRREMRPVLDVFARHRVPLTLFVTNRSMSGGDNRQLISVVDALFKERSIPLEVASHSVDHEDLRRLDLPGVVAKVRESLREFHSWGIPVHGFRAPYLGIEPIYRDVLTCLSADGGWLHYDSSVSFEAGLATSLFHAFTKRKSPHKVDKVWELPISCLDDYHLLQKRKLGTRIAYSYWVCEAHLWVRSTNYFMVLFHPYVMVRHLGLLDRFLAYCQRRFSPGAFCMCMDLVSELELDFSGSGAEFHRNL